MKPAWDQLGGEYADSSSVVIGDADCTASAEELCGDFGVQGYPTIKYFKDGDITEGKDYQGGRDYDTLKAFVVDNLEVLCDVSSGDECSDKEKGYIEKMKGKGKEEIKKQLDRLDGMAGSSMKSDLKKWLNQRLRILKHLHEEL